jgi:putative heme-binding domain-containing protein
VAWNSLGENDRYVRFAARVALEHQDAKLWADKALAETDPVKATHALLALARVSAPCPEHTPDKKVKGDPALRAKIVASLGRIDFAKLSDSQKLDLVRVYHVLFNRFGMPSDAERSAVVAKFDPLYPVGSRFVDGELSQLMVYLQAPSAAAKTMKLLAAAPTQEEQLEYVRALRVLKAGWTPELRKDYFAWFQKATSYRGGASFLGFLKLIRTDAVATLTDPERESLKDLIAVSLDKATPPDETPRAFVKAWKVDDLAPALENGLKGGRDYDSGRKLFAAAKCFACHRFDNEGGSNGPDLTAVAGRFGPRDLLESVIDPNKEISDQYGAVEVRTLSGKLVVGRIVNLNNNSIQINTNMLDPGNTTSVDRNDVESMKASKISMMPAGLLDTLKEDEVLDLMAYMLSRGDRKHAMFKK